MSKWHTFLVVAINVFWPAAWSPGLLHFLNGSDSYLRVVDWLNPVILFVGILALMVRPPLFALKVNFLYYVLYAIWLIVNCFLPEADIHSAVGALVIGGGYLGSALVLAALHSTYSRTAPPSLSIQGPSPASPLTDKQP